MNNLKFVMDSKIASLLDNDVVIVKSLMSQFDMFLNETVNMLRPKIEGNLQNISKYLKYI